MHITFHEQDFILDGRRALFWKQKEWLLIADVHWGKTHYFQKHGLSVGHGVLKADLERLASLIEFYHPKMVMCLGDLIHHEHSLGPELIEEVTDFRNRYPLPLTLIRGNHERYISKLPEQLGIEIIDDKFECDGLTLCHEEEKGCGPQLFGHLHPKISLKGQGDNLSLPCFYQTGQNLILPAFSDFCGGKSITLNKSECAYICCDDYEVIQIP